MLIRDPIIFKFRGVSQKFHMSMENNQAKVFDSKQTTPGKNQVKTKGMLRCRDY